jgi:hypothetical protein
MSGDDLKRIVKEDLISIIIDAGLLDEFIAWLNRKAGGHVDPIRLDSIEIDYIVEFLREKNLISSDTISFELASGDPIEEIEKNVRENKEKRTRKYKPT